MKKHDQNLLLNAACVCSATSKTNGTILKMSCFQTALLRSFQMSSLVCTYVCMFACGAFSTSNMPAHPFIGRSERSPLVGFTVWLLFERWTFNTFDKLVVVVLFGLFSQPASQPTVGGAVAPSDS